MTRNAKILLTALIFVTLGSTVKVSAAQSESGPILESSLNDLAQSVGLKTESPGSSSSKPRKIKIAILDNGFRGFKNALGRTIPQRTKLRVGPVVVSAGKGEQKNLEEEHGLKIAEIFSGLLDKTDIPYDLELFYAFGHSNLKSAIENVIQEKFDIVLYSQVWEYGGNGDGLGFINTLVSKATAAGVLWVNAAGNFAKSTYMAPVDRVADDWAYLPGPNDSVQIRCFKNATGVCRLRLVLSWNSFANDIETGTDKDLDLVLTDDVLKVIKTGGLVQKKSVTLGEPGASLYPREIIEAEIKPGLYFARVKIQSKNFTKADVLKIAASGDFIEVLNRTEGETLFPPADNPSVITVGASDSDMSSFSRTKSRPDLKARSLISTENELQFKGSSNSAAAFAARLATEVSRSPSQTRLTRDQALALLRGERTSPRNQPDVGPLKPTPPVTSVRADCYPFVTLPFSTPKLLAMVQQGGNAVQTTSGVKIFINENPFTRASRLNLSVHDDGSGREILLIDGRGLFSAPGSSRSLLGGMNVIEFVETPKDTKYCDLQVR